MTTPLHPVTTPHTNWGSTPSPSPMLRMPTVSREEFEAGLYAHRKRLQELIAAASLPSKSPSTPQAPPTPQPPTPQQSQQQVRPQTPSGGTQGPQPARFLLSPELLRRACMPYIDKMLEELGETIQKEVEKQLLGQSSGFTPIGSVVGSPGVPGRGEGSAPFSSLLMGGGGCDDPEDGESAEPEPEKADPLLVSAQASSMSSGSPSGHAGSPSFHASPNQCQRVPAEAASVAGGSSTAEGAEPSSASVEFELTVRGTAQSGSPQASTTTEPRGEAALASTRDEKTHSAGVKPLAGIEAGRWPPPVGRHFGAIPSAQLPGQIRRDPMYLEYTQSRGGHTKQVSPTTSSVSPPLLPGGSNLRGSYSTVSEELASEPGAQPGAVLEESEGGGTATAAEKSIMNCRHWKSKGFCRLGDQCKFQHPPQMGKEPHEVASVLAAAQMKRKRRGKKSSKEPPAGYSSDTPSASGGNPTAQTPSSPVTSAESPLASPGASAHAP